MWNDPIVDEVRKVREEHAAKFNFDIDAIIKDLQSKQNKSTKLIITYKNGEYVNSDSLSHRLNDVVSSSL